MYQAQFSFRLPVNKMSEAIVGAQIRALLVEKEADKILPDLFSNLQLIFDQRYYHVEL